MDWTIGKKSVPGHASRRAWGLFPQSWRQRAVLPSVALVLLGWAATSVQAGVSFSQSDVTIASQAILPSSAPTAVLSINANATDSDRGTRAADSLTVSLIGVNNFSATSDIVAVYLFADSSITPGTLSYDNFELGTGTTPPNVNGIYPVGTCLGYFGAPFLTGGRWLGTVSSTMSFTSLIRNDIAFPTNDTGSNAGADYFIAIQTSDGLQHRASFQVRSVYTYLVIGNPSTTTTVTTTTNTITCEYYVQNMTDRSGYHGWGWGSVHLYGVDGTPATYANIMGISTPYLLFGLNIAGRSGLTNSSYTTEYLTGLEILFTNRDNDAIFAYHPIATYPDVGIWEDTNNNGYFDPSFELTSGGTAGGDRFIGPADITGGPVGTQRAHNRGAVTQYIDGRSSTTAPTPSYVASERTIDLEGTADNQIDFFVCLSTDPSHIWVTDTPLYGDRFAADLQDNPTGLRSINFWYARQSGTDYVTGTTKEVAILRAPQPSTNTLGDHEPVDMTIGVAISKTPSPAGYLEADGFPEAIFNFNLADGTGLGRNEAIEQIRVWFSGAGFKPTDLMPLTDDEYSGISLWWDNKLEGMDDASNQLGQFDPPQGVTWMGQTQNGQTLHSVSFTDTNLPLSSSSLTWYNGGDNSPWSPYNDTGPDYYVVLKPKAPIGFPPVDYDWQNDAAHGHQTIGDNESLSGSSPINFRGPDLFVCVRASGMKNASYGSNWWERGMDLGDQLTAEIRSPSDILYSRKGINTSLDQLPVSITQTLSRLPLAYNVLTTQSNQPISPFYNTAVVGINLVAPDRTLFSGVSVWRTIDSIEAASDGSAVLTVAPRSLANGDVVSVSGSPYYDGDWIVADTSGDSFEIRPQWVAETFGGSAVVNGVAGVVLMSGVASAGDGSAIFTAPGHVLQAGEFIRISGTTNYNGLYVVKAVAGSTFEVAVRYAARQYASANVASISGSTRLDSVVDTAIGGTVFAAPGHQLVVGQPATIGGTTTYDGLYVVTASNPAIGTFELGPRFVGQTFAAATVTGGLSGTTTLESVASGTGQAGSVADGYIQVATFTAPGHALSVGEVVSIAGTTGYDGLYLVTASDIALGTFQVAPRYLAETFGNIGGTLITSVSQHPVRSGQAVFYAPGQSFSVGDIATIGGTMIYSGNTSYYAGSYAITDLSSPAADYVSVSPPCLPSGETGTVTYSANPGGDAVTAVTAATDGSAQFEAPGHTLTDGDIATISGTTNYNAEYVATATNQPNGTFEAHRSHLTETFNIARINGVLTPISISSDANGSALVTAVGQNYTDGTLITIINAGSYSGKYVVAYANPPDEFLITPQYQTEDFATVTNPGAGVSVPLQNVYSSTEATSGATGVATFYAPGHLLNADDTVTISGAGIYDGTFTVLWRSSTTFQVVPQGASVTYADAVVNTTLGPVAQSGTRAWFSSPDRDFAVGDPVRISGTTYYNGDYSVTDFDTGQNRFFLGPLYVDTPIPTLNATIPITTITNESNYASVTAPGSTLASGGAAVVAGSVDYNGNFVALDPGFGATKLAPKFVAETPAAGAIGKRITSVTQDPNGLPLFTAPGHGYSTGATVFLAGAATYNGTYVVTAAATNSFELLVPYATGTLGSAPAIDGNTFTVANDGGRAKFTIASHPFVQGQTVTVSGSTLYDGVRMVNVVDANSLYLSPVYSAADFSTSIAVAGTKLSGAVTAASVLTGSAKFAATGHGLAAGNLVWIGGTTNYNGHYIVHYSADVNSVELAVSYVGDEINNARVNGKSIVKIADSGDGDALFTVTGHGFAEGSTVTVSGTGNSNYDRSFYVTDVTTDTFRLSARYVAETFTTAAKIGTPLVRVSPLAGHNEVAYFVAPGHGLSVGDYASFAGTTNNDRDFVILSAPLGGSDLQVSLRYMSAPAPGARVSDWPLAANPLPLSSVSDYLGTGMALFTTFTPHGFSDGDFVTISNTTNYNDDYVVQRVDNYSFLVGVRCLTPLTGTVNGAPSFLSDVYNDGAGRAVFLAPGFGLANGDMVKLSGTATATVNYDGVYVATNVSAVNRTFEVKPRYVVQTFSGATVGAFALDSVANNPIDNSAIFSAPDHPFAPTNTVTISGAGIYNGTYIVTAVNVNGVEGTFQVSLPYVAMELANVDGTPLESVSNAGGLQTLFAATGHGLGLGSFCAIGGTVNYNGDYVVVPASDADTFQTVRGCAAAALSGATVTVGAVVETLDAVTDAGDHSALFSSVASLVPGDVATIAGTTGYDGTYVVTATPTPGSTFQVGPRCVPPSIANAGISSMAVDAVTDAGDGTALFLAPDHGLVTGDFITLSGTGGYAGYYVATVADTDSFKVLARYVADAASGLVNGTTVITSITEAADGSALVTTSGAHGLVNGARAVLTGTTYYNGSFVAAAATANTFKLSMGVTAPPRIQNLVVEVRDTGVVNFDYSDLIDPAAQHPAENQEDGGCGIAVYIDNPIAGQQGIFDEHDVRMPMSAVPYIAGPPQLPTQIHLNFSPETVIADPGSRLVGTGGTRDQATGSVPASFGLAADAVFQDRNGNGTYDPGIDAAWIDVNHSGAYEAGTIATGDTGVNAGNDFFLVVRPTRYMDPGDDFTLQVYNVWFGDDKLYTSTGSTHVTTRFTTHRMRNSVVTNDTLTDEVTPGLLTVPNGGAYSAMGINVSDPTGAGRLTVVRVYFNPEADYDPDDLLAPLSGSSTGGLSLWNIASGANIPVQAGTWHDEAEDSLVYHMITVPPTSVTAVPIGSVLTWFEYAENVCWADNDQDGKWSTGDALWINTSAISESSVRYNHGYDTPLVAGATNDGNSGVILQHNVYGFGYYDANGNNLFDLDEDIYFLGPGRRILGWYTDLVLTTPTALPANNTGTYAGKDFEVRFRTNANPPIFGTLGWTFSIPNQSVTYNTGHSSANQNLTTGLIRLEVVPTTISDFTASRGAGRVTLNWTLPVSTFTSVMIVRTPTAVPGVSEVPMLGVPYAVGQPIGNGTVVYMGSGSTFVDNGVVNGTPYYYWAFAGDRSPTGRGPEDMVQATPWPVTPTEDSTPPGVVTNLDATPGDNSVLFTWDDPLDLDLAEIIIVRSSTDYPANRPADETAYAVGADLGDGIVVGKVAAGVQTFLDDGDGGAGVAAPANGTTYYYTFYTHDAYLNYSAPATINCMPSDGSAADPRAVTSFGLSVVVDAGGNHDVNLAWNWPTPVGNPETGLIIVRNFGSPISGVPSPGRLYRVGDALASGETGTVVAIIGDTATVTYTDQDVMGGGTYYYAAFTYNSILEYSSGAYSNQVVSSAAVSYVDLTTAGQTIEFDSTPTAVIGVNLYDNNQGAVLGSVTVQFNRLGNNSIYDLADINGTTTTSGVALYRDSNGNGVFNAGVDTLVPFTLGSGWSRGTPLVYDRKMDTPILDLTNWRAVDGVVGIQTGVYYLDSNDNGTWDPGEDIWAGTPVFGVACTVLYTGGSQEVVNGLVGIQTGLSYYDEDGSNSYTPGESLWRDESWPRMLTMNLTSGLDVPNTDTGTDLGSDLFVVIRTSHTIRYGTQIQLAVPGTFGLTFFGEEAGVAGLTTNAVTCRIPTTLTNLVSAGQTIAVSSPSTPVLGMDLADPSQTVDSLTLDLLNVGGDFDITPSDFVSYIATDQEGPVAFWRDMRPVAPSSLGGIITVTSAAGNRTQVRVAGVDFASLGVRVGDVIRRVSGAVTTTAAVTALQSTVTANDTLVFMNGLSGVGGDHSLDAGDEFVVETRFLVSTSPVINVADATYYPTAGLVRLGRELVSYAGKDTHNNLLNVVRGVQGTTAAITSHPVGESLRVIGMTSTLAADLTAAATTVTLAAGEGPRFQNPGLGYTAYVRIGDEIIGYRTRVGDQLQQCTRGAKGSDAVPHIAGTTVADAMPLTLMADIDAAMTDIDVLGRPFAPAAKTGIGHVTIGLEVISYTSVIRISGGWRLSGCVRGVSGTGADIHTAGDAVVQGRPGTFDLEADSLVFLSSLPASGMSIPLNIRNQPLSPMIDDIMDFFVTVKTSSSASHNDDFQVRLASGALDFSVSATSDSLRGITSNTLRVNATDTTAPVITQVRTLDLNQNGMVDHVVVTFSEPVSDASLTGYISEAIAFLTDRWLLQGYTGIGIDPNGTTGWTDTEDDNHLVLFLDEKAIDIPNDWLGDTGALLDLGTASATLTDLNSNLLNGGADYAFGTLQPLTVDGAAPVLVDAFSNQPLTLTGEIAAGTVLTLRFSEPVTSLDVVRIAATDLLSSYDGVAGLANGFNGILTGDVTASITAGGDVALAFAQESTSGGLWTEDATLNLDSSTLSEGDIVDLVGFNALAAPAAVPIRGLGSVVVLSAETGDVDRDGRIDYIRITFDRPVDDSTLQGYPGTGNRIDVAANGSHFQVVGRGQVMIDLDGPSGTDVADNNVLYLVFGEGGAPDTSETPTLTIASAQLRSLDGEYTRDYSAATTDAAPPVMIDVITYDLDENGSVDTAVVEFSEKVDDITADPGDFTIGGMPVDAVATGSAALPAFPNVPDDEVLILQILVPANQVLGTDYKTVAYTQDDDGFDLADLLGNEMASDTDGGRWGNKLDGAKPTIQSARTLTDASVQVTFSEAVLGVTTAMLKLNNGALSLGTLVQTGPRTYVWSDPVGNARWNTDASGNGPGDIDDSDGYRSTDSSGTARNVTPNLTVAAGAFSDAWGNANLAITNSTLTLDATVPVVVAVSTMDFTPDGRVDSAAIILSEPMNEATILASQFAIGGTVGTTFVSGTFANDQAFTIRHGGVAGTELKAVAYVAGTAADMQGNLLASNANLGFTKTDLAKPYLLTARSRSDRSMELVFSEQVVPPLPTALAVNGGAISFTTVDTSANPVLVWGGADATWNTDATGTSAGTGTDATGTNQAAILDLAIAADAVLDLAAAPNGNIVIASTMATDGAAPVVTKLYSTVTPGSTHTLGQLVPILVDFSERVTVAGGTPTLVIQVSDTTQRTLSYQSGSGTRVLRFNYTVGAGDNRLDPDYLDCPDTGSLAFGGSTITDSASIPNTAVLALPIPGVEYAPGGLYGPLYGHHVQIDTVPPEVLATETVDHDTLKVTFSELILNDTDQIAAALPFMGISDGGTPESVLTFDAVSLDPDNTVATSTAASFNVVYLHMTDAAKRWNTDATGTSAGSGTDGSGVVRTSIPKLFVVPSVLSDLVNNPIADTTFDTTTDGAPPVALGGVYLDTNADGRVETLEVLFSEGVDLGATGNWTLTPSDLPLDPALGAFTRPNVRTVSIAVSALGVGTGVDNGGGETEPSLAFNDAGAGDIQDQSPAANGADPFVLVLADQAGPVLESAELATPGVARLTFSEKLDAATVDAAGSDFTHSSSTITAAVTVDAWAGARLTLNPVLGQTDVTTVRFASAGTVTDPEGNPNVDVAPVSLAAYLDRVALVGPPSNVMHRGAVPIDVTGLVDVLNAVPEDDLDEWNLYLVQGQGGTRLPIADASTRLLNGPVAIPMVPVFPADSVVLGAFTPDTDAVDGVYHYTLVLEVKFNTGETPLYVYHEVEIAKDLPETGQVNDGAGADIDFQQSTTQLVANWSGIAMSGVTTSSYEVAYSTDPANYPSLPGDWTNVGGVTAVTLPGLTLAGGTTYYVKVRALDAGGTVIAVQTSDGVTVDITGPAGTVVRDGAAAGVDAAWLVQNHAFAANWDAFVDPGSVDEEPDPSPVIGSGTASYSMAVYRVVGDPDPASAEVDDVMVTAGFSPVGSGLSAQLELGAGALAHGATYYAAVRATDGVGNVGDPVYSDGATVDLAAPQPTTILDGDTAGVDIDLTNSPDTLAANWLPFTDDVSGPPTEPLIYMYRVVTGLDDVTGWQTHATNSALKQARQYFTSVRLADGRLLVTGGWTGTQVLKSTEIFDPATGNWTLVASMNTARMNAASALLPDGRVVVAGGETINGYLGSIEVYDPVNNTWTTAANGLGAKRAQFSAVALNSGIVWFIAGRGEGNLSLSSIESFNPSTGAVNPAAGSVTVARRGAKTEVLADGRILVIGGETDSGFSSTVDMYTPGVGWSVGALATARSQFATCMLPTGELLVLGGRNGSGKLKTVEMYDGAVWSLLPGTMNTARAAFGAVWVESESRVLVVGGLTGTDGSGDTVLASTETFDPALGVWSFGSDLNVPRGYHKVAIFDNGLVLAYGGLANYIFATACEWRRYAVAITQWVALSSAESVNPLTVSLAGLPLEAGRKYFIQVRAYDTAGNASAIVASDGVVVDTAAPVPTVTAPSSPTNASPLVFNVTFSESISGFDSGDLILGNGTVAPFAGLSGTTFNVSVTPSGQGAVTLAVAAAGVVDIAGNGNVASAVASATYKSIGPACVLAGPASPNRLTTMPFTATFAEPVTGFTTSSKISVTNGRVTTSVTTTDNLVFRFSVAPFGEGDVTVQVLTGAGKDSLGNNSLASNPVVVVYDITAPVAALTGVPAALTTATDIDITVGGTGVVRYTYSLDGSAESGITDIGINIFHVGLADGSHVLRVWGIDAAGNKQGTATTASWTVDTVAPVATLTGRPTNPSKSAELRLTVGGTGVVAYTYSLDGAGETAPVGVGAGLVELGLSDGPHTVLVWGIDAAGNKQVTATAVTWTVDTAAPVATLTSLSGPVTFENPIRYRMTFNENVADFAAADLTVAGTVTDFVVVSAQQYTFGVVPTVARGIETTVTVTLASGKVNDAAGNACAGTALSVLYYTEPPARVTLVPDATEVAVGESFTVSVYVKELSSAANGFRGGPLDLNFSTTQADVVVDGAFDPATVLNSAVGTNFTGIFTSGTLNEGAGLIDELGGVTTANNLGEGELPDEDAAGVLYAVVPFVATAPGKFTMLASAAQAGLTLTPPVGTLPVALVDYGQAVDVIVTTEVTLSVTGSTSFAENGGTTTLQVSLGDPATEDVTVALAFAGTATLGTDYSAVPTSVVVASGSSTGTVTLTGLDDAVYEGAEAIVVSINTVTSISGAYRESGNQEVALAISDDDFAPGDLAGGDGKVDFYDLNEFIGHYGTTVGGGSYSAAADLDHDGDVDFYDLNIFIGLYGTNYNSTRRGPAVASAVRSVTSTATVTLVGPTEVALGDTFNVDVYLQTNDSHGIGTGLLDVAFDAARVGYSGDFVPDTIVQYPYNSMYTIGSLNGAGGLVDELGGATTQAGKGYGTAVFFARLHFVATAPGEAVFQSAAASAAMMALGNGEISAANTSFGSLSVTVTTDDVAPVADDLTVETETNMPVTCGLSASDADGDALQFTLPTVGTAGYPAHGSIAFARATANVVYTPDADFTGTDSFTFEVSDGILSDTGTVTVLVGGFTSSLKVLRGAQDYATLTYGRRIGASDEGLAADGDLPAATLPGETGAYFQVSGGESSYLWTDYRPLGTTTAWRLCVIVPGTVTRETWQVAWDGTGLPSTGNVVLTPCNAAWEPTGAQVDLRVAGSRTLANEGAEAQTFRFLVVASEKVEVTYNLCHGWNLIGVPINADADSVADFLADEGVWVVYEWSEATGYKVATSLQAGRGYWVYALSEDVTLTLVGIPRVGGIALTAGWNLVSASTSGSGDPGEANGAVVTSWLWNATGMSYAKPDAGGIPANCGVWVFVNEDTVIWNSR